MTEMYCLTDLTDRLIEIAKENLPEFSGQNKVLDILVQFNYGEEDPQFLQLLFWHPQKAMLVAFCAGPRIEDFDDQYCVTANHSTCWKYDGFSFYHKALPKPESWDLIEFQTRDVEVTEVGSLFFVEPMPTVPARPQ